MSLVSYLSPASLLGNIEDIFLDIAIAILFIPIAFGYQLPVALVKSVGENLRKIRPSTTFL